MSLSGEAKILYGVFSVALGVATSCSRPEPVQTPIMPSAAVSKPTSEIIEPRFGGIIIKPEGGKSILSGDLSNYSSYTLEVHTERLDKIVKELQSKSNLPMGGELVMNIFADRTLNSAERGMVVSDLITLMRISNGMREFPEWPERGRVYNPADLRFEVMYLELGDTSEFGMSERLIKHMFRGSQSIAIPFESIVIPSHIRDQIARQTIISIRGKTAFNPLRLSPTPLPGKSA